jgi:hypothetical protein
MEPACCIGIARFSTSVCVPTAPHWSVSHRSFRIAFAHKGQLVRASEDVSPCLLELSRRVEDVKPGVSGAKTTTQSACNRGLHQAKREIVAFVDNNVL